MNNDRQLPRLPYDEPDPDPATRAFNRLEGEMAMMRRAVEHLATEKSEIDLLLIGMGPEMARPPKPVRAALESAGLMYDPMATGHAVSTYNLLLEEKRRVEQPWLFA